MKLQNESLLSRIGLTQKPHSAEVFATLDQSITSGVSSTTKIANKRVLSNLCDKIQTVSGLMNANVRRMFRLQSLIEPVDSDCSGGEGSDYRFLPKDQLMLKLEEFENLINAMGALFYASKRMTSQIPCCF